jgi:hypothetical protein
MEEGELGYEAQTGFHLTRLRGISETRIHLVAELVLKSTYLVNVGNP